MHTCPHCNETFPNLTQLNGETAKGPKPGDFTICNRCGEPARWDDKMTLQKVKPIDLARLLRHQPELLIGMNFASMEIKKRNFNMAQQN